MPDKIYMVALKPKGCTVKLCYLNYTQLFPHIMFNCRLQRYAKQCHRYRHLQAIRIHHATKDTDFHISWQQACLCSQFSNSNSNKCQTSFIAIFVKHSTISTKDNQHTIVWNTNIFQHLPTLTTRQWVQETLSVLWAPYLLQNIGHV